MTLLLFIILSLSLFLCGHSRPSDDDDINFDDDDISVISHLLPVDFDGNLLKPIDFTSGTDNNPALGHTEHIFQDTVSHHFEMDKEDPGHSVSNTHVRAASSVPYARAAPHAHSVAQRSPAKTSQDAVKSKKPKAKRSWLRTYEHPIYRNMINEINSDLIRKFSERMKFPQSLLPWKELTEDDMIGWPESVLFRRPSKLGKGALTRLYHCLDGIDFSEAFIQKMRSFYIKSKYS